VFSITLVVSALVEMVTLLAKLCPMSTARRTSVDDSGGCEETALAWELDNTAPLTAQQIATQFYQNSSAIIMGLREVVVRSGQQSPSPPSDRVHRLFFCSEGVKRRAHSPIVRHLSLEARQPSQFRKLNSIFVG
jgi:hypothetical protein